MTAADIELAKMIYLASALGVVLFTSMILRGLWRPLRFVLISMAISVFFTPYFLAQKMPDGSDQNIIPSFVYTLHKAAEDKERWREIIPEVGKPIAVVGAINAGIALILALVLPKPRKKIKAKAKKAQALTQDSHANTEAPDTKQHKQKTKNKKKNKKRHKNRYLPADFVPPAQQQAKP